jgi:hypothetical protein
VSSAAVPLTDSLDATVAPLTDTASSAIAPAGAGLGSVTDTLDATVGPATDSLGGLSAGAQDPLSAVLSPVNETVDVVATPFVAAVEDVAVAPLADTVDQTTRPAAPTPGDVAASAGDRGETSVAGSAGGGGGAPGGGATGAEDLVPAAPGSTGLEGGGLPGGFPTDAAATQPGAALSDGPAAGPTFGGADIVQPPFAASPPADVAAAAAPPRTGGESTFDVIAATATDPSVLTAATGLAVLVGAGLVGSRLGCAAEARLLFTNVRLLPCMVRTNVGNLIPSLTPTLPASGPAGPAAALRPAVASEGAVAGTSAVNDPPPGEIERSDARTGLLGSFRDGFEDAIQGGRRDIGDSLGDSRLMLQLGMALGFVYAGFLSVWFWATRLRRRPGD